MRSALRNTPASRNQPISPVPSKTITLGLLGGLAAGLAFVFGADALDRSMKTVDQAETTLGLPCFGGDPGNKSSNAKEEEVAPGQQQRRTGSKRPCTGWWMKAPEARSPRVFEICARRFRCSARKPTARFFFSPAPCLTKEKVLPARTTLSRLAQQGQRVLLVDGDLRRPSIHKVFGVSLGRARIFPALSIIWCARWR